MERPKVLRRDKTVVTTEAEFSKRRLSREQAQRPIGQLALFSETGDRDTFIYPESTTPGPGWTNGVVTLRDPAERGWDLNPEPPSAA